MIQRPARPFRVILATETASMRMSGETAIPLYYFKGFLKRGADVRMVVHERVKAELSETLLEHQFARITFIKDSTVQEYTWKLMKRAPERVRSLIVDQGIHLLTQLTARELVKRLVRQYNADTVFEPIPITPKGVSCMYDVGAPVVIGPMCGGLEFPPAFKYMDSTFARLSVVGARKLSPLVHKVFPGKTKAAALICANARTERALPPGCGGRRYTLVESGVDLSLWQPVPHPKGGPEDPVRFVFMARFVDWKGIYELIDAFALAVKRSRVVLELIGDGELFESSKERVARLGIGDHVRFHGRMPLREAAKLIHDCDVYMATGLRECGGLALLESMAMGLPVIGADWAGIGEYLDDTCGIRVAPTTRQSYVEGLADAMVRLASSVELRQRLGEGAVKRVRSNCFDWESKTDRALEILKEVAEDARAGKSDRRQARRPMVPSGQEVGGP